MSEKRSASSAVYTSRPRSAARWETGELARSSPTTTKGRGLRESPPTPFSERARVTGIVIGALEEAARIKLARGDLNRFCRSEVSGRIQRTGWSSRDERSSAAPR
jgi:hypothetical protein